MGATEAMAVVEDERYREHRTPVGHPERPERLIPVGESLAAFETQLSRVSPRPAEADEILRVHRAAHLREIELSAERAPESLDPDTFVSPESFQVARLAAGASIDLTLRVARGEARCALAAVRPPGHHAESNQAMGFCLFNNVAIAARAAQVEAGVGKILILDWDVHHGNGTQHIFEQDPSVLYASTHQFPFYPGTGDAAETGSGKGVGATLNIPMPAGCGDDEYRGVLLHLLSPVARAFSPEMILVSCGFDAHRSDPLGSMELSAAGFLAMTRILRALAEEICGGRVAFVLEGGYADQGLREGTRAVLEGMLEPEPPQWPSAAKPEAGGRLQAVVDRVVAAHRDRHPEIRGS